MDNKIFYRTEGVAVFHVSLCFSATLPNLFLPRPARFLSIISEEFAKGKEKAAKVANMMARYLNWISLLVMVIARLFTPNVLELFLATSICLQCRL